MTQWLRKITVDYGQRIPGSALGPVVPWSLTSEGDSDFRIQFRFNRTNTNRADTGRLVIYNLPPEFLSAIRVGTQEANDDRLRILEGPKFKGDLDGRNRELKILSRANLVKIYAGYRDGTKLIFTGDITRIDLRSMMSDTDTITTIELGDTIIPLKYGWMNKSFGGDSSTAEVLGAVVSAFSNESEQAKIFRLETILGVEVLEYRNGYALVGGIKRNLDAIVARYGVQWFVKDGEFFFMARGAMIDDFAMRLDLGDNVLRPLNDIDGDSVKFTMLLDGDMIPGRGFRIYGEDGEPTSKKGYRADTVSYIGDTHGNPWYCMVEGISIDGVVLPPSATLTADQAFATENVAVPP